MKTHHSSAVAQSSIGQIKMIMKKLILTSSFLLLTSYFAPAATVEAEGRAPGDMKTARELTNFSK